MEIKVVELQPIENGGALQAFATVSIGGIVVRDYRVVRGKSGTLFVTPPQRTWTGRDGQPHHTFVVDVPEPLRAEVQAKVLAAYEGGAGIEGGFQFRHNRQPHTPAPPS